MDDDFAFDVGDSLDCLSVRHNPGGECADRPSRQAEKATQHPAALTNARSKRRGDEIQRQEHGHWLGTRLELSLGDFQW